MNRTLEHRTMAKISWRLLPLIVVIYFVAYIDRTNVGFAASGMNKELGFTAYVYGWGAGIFFLGYFLFEVPSNVMLHRFGARVWIARILVTWGIVSGVMMFTSLAAMSLAAIGLYGSKPAFWPLPSTFMSGTAAAGGIAMVNSVGNLGGFVGPYIVGWIKESTQSYTPGLYFLAACAFASGVIALFAVRSAAAPAPQRQAI